MKPSELRAAGARGGGKPGEPTDPLELVGETVPGGDPEFLARCLVEELAGLGHGADEILTLFRSPGYAVPYAVYRSRGEAAVRGWIEEVLEECGVFRVSEAVGEPADPGPGPAPSGRRSRREGRKP